MQCNLCGKDFVQLGVHIRAKHDMSPHDYKMQYDIPLGTALAEPSLTHRLSLRAKQRLQTDEGKAHFEHLRTVAPKGSPKGKRDMPKCHNKHLAALNNKKSQEYYDKYYKTILIGWLEGKSQSALAREAGISTSYIRNLIKRNQLPKR